MMQATKVTALLPAYQSAGFIQATLDSLSAQTHPNFDVMVSVDQCDDDTHAVCVAHAARDARFRVVRQAARLGYVGNCNFLLGQADSDYVLFAFHDDILAPRYLEALCGMLDRRPEAVMSFSDLALTQVDGSTRTCAFDALEGVHENWQRGLKMLQRSDNWWVPNRGVFRLTAVRTIGGLRTNGAGEFSCDWPWMFRMSLLGEFARVPEVLCHKYFKPGSLSKSWAYSAEQHYEVSVACMRELWNSNLASDDKLRLAQPLLHWLFKVRGEVDRAAAHSAGPQ